MKKGENCGKRGEARRNQNRTLTERLETEKFRDRKILVFHFSVPKFLCLLFSGLAYPHDQFARFAKTLSHSGASHMNEVHFRVVRVFGGTQRMFQPRIRVVSAGLKRVDLRP
jgi:hypothetical protein